MTVLCKCCEDHPDEAQESNETVTCVECGEKCQCEGCIVDSQYAINDF